jgi:anti-anti-sigma regulatory factor
LRILYSSSHHIAGQEFEPVIHMDWPPHTSQASSATPALTVTLSRPQPNTTVCTLTGAVNWNTRPLLSNALTQARHDNTHLVIDLSAVTTMNSAGPYTLLEARAKHHLNGGGQIAVITNPNSSAIPELQTVAIQAAFTVHPTLTDALHACAHPNPPTNHPTPQTTTAADITYQPSKHPVSHPRSA